MTPFLKQASLWNVLQECMRNGISTFRSVINFNGTSERLQAASRRTRVDDQVNHVRQ